ncbi:hypothetical protein niasHS_014013 [Heterodera schachtii]|uniref:Phosphatidylinositol transfer protein N-terminal domain-containing protein n=1 Tax=Heterodera schachtii TaxID=97005 RepID=A0ABD2IKE7_HETSC
MAMAASPKCRLSEHELSWNAFPYCKTELTNPDYMKDDFLIWFETMHLSDRATTKTSVFQALGLSKGVLNERKVVCIDIATTK